MGFMTKEILFVGSVTLAFLLGVFFATTIIMNLPPLYPLEGEETWGGEETIVTIRQRPIAEVEVIETSVNCFNGTSMILKDEITLFPSWALLPEGVEQGTIIDSSDCLFIVVTNGYSGEGDSYKDESH